DVRPPVELPVRGGEIQNGRRHQSDVHDVDAGGPDAVHEGGPQIGRRLSIVLAHRDDVAALAEDQRRVGASNLLEHLGIDVAADASTHVVSAEDVGIQHTYERTMRGMKLEAPALLGLFEQAAAGIVLGSPDGHATLNPAARELLGLPSEAAVSALPRPSLVNEALRGAVVAGALVEGAHGGPNRMLVVRWAPLRENGKIVAALGVMQDASRGGGDEALPRASRMSDEFYALIAHQLRTPLTPILGWARMLMQQRPDDPVLRRAAEVIERNVRIEVRLVDDMLDVTRIQRGTLELVMRPVDMSDICRSVVADQRRWTEGRTLSLDLEVPDRPLALNADPARIEQIVTALIANAVRFTPDGGRVTVSVMPEGSHVVCVVSDTGEGIAPTLLPRIFDFSLEVQHSAGRRGGLGVSLAIARYLAERHGGTLRAESEGPGRGAQFML